MHVRPTCGRPTKSGDSCRAVVRYSAALSLHAPACRQHMTDSERLAVDDNPLWTRTGQVRWYLEQRSDAELVNADQIAHALDMLSGEVSATLRELEAEAAVASYSIGGRRRWGTHGQVQRLVDAERQLENDRAVRLQRIVDDNESLDAIVDMMAHMLSDRAIGVTSFRRMYPSAAADAKPDHLVLTTDDLPTAKWLLEKLTSSDDSE